MCHQVASGYTGQAINCQTCLLATSIEQVQPHYYHLVSCHLLYLSCTNINSTMHKTCQATGCTGHQVVHCPALPALCNTTHNAAQSLPHTTQPSKVHSTGGEHALQYCLLCKNYSPLHIHMPVLQAPQGTMCANGFSASYPPSSFC